MSIVIYSNRFVLPTIFLLNVFPPIIGFHINVVFAISLADVVPCGVVPCLHIQHLLCFIFTFDPL